MTSDPFARSRMRKVLVAVIIATIPCYCAGLVAVLLAPGGPGHPSGTPTTLPSFTLVVYVTQTSTTSYTPLPFVESATPSQTPTSTATATSTITPTITQTPTISSTPTPSNTPFIPPTFTKTPQPTATYTFTPTPTFTNTPLPSITNTPSPSVTNTPSTEPLIVGNISHLSSNTYPSFRDPLLTFDRPVTR